MNRLITFGCSYTQGIGLDGLNHKAHLYYDSPRESVLKIQSASKDAWPHLLAVKRGLECINLGRGGSGPKYVFQMIREFKFQKTDIVVIQWPSPARYIIWKEDNESEIGSYLSVEPGHTSCNDFYRKYYTEFNSLYDNAVLIESTHAYLKDKCDQVHSTMRCIKIKYYLTPFLFYQKLEDSLIDTTIPKIPATMDILEKVIMYPLPKTWKK